MAMVTNRAAQTEVPQSAPFAPFRTLFLQEIIKRGIIAPSLVVNEAFTSNDIQHALWAFKEAADVYATALHDGIGKYLVGRPVKPVFRKRA